MEEQMSLAELRAAVKLFRKESPKLSSKKSDLQGFAERVGITKKKEVAVEPPPPTISEKQPKVVPKLVKPEVLPAILKKSLPLPPKASVSQAPVKKVATGFAGFMSENKGKGYSMKELAELYKSSK